MLVSGRIQAGSYVNRESVKVYTTDVIVSTQEFADSKRSNQGSGGESIGDGFMRIPDGVDDEGLPFN